MGLNAQTSVPEFTTGQVLTAQQQTDINTGIPVFADTTARDAAFGGSGEKVLAEGQYAYLESTNQTLVYDGSNWISVSVAPGLVLVKSQTIGTTVASVTVTDVFSANYDQYKIVVTGGVASTTNQLRLQLGATTTGYYWGGVGQTYAGAGNSGAGSNAANIFVGNGSTKTLMMNSEVGNPFAAKETIFTGMTAIPTTTGASLNFAGFLDNTTSYTDFTILLNTGTISDGIIRVYGYTNS
jgi:hypothetical protein